VARHRSKDVDLYRQGDINFIANYEPKALRRTTSPRSTAPAPAAWRFACATRTAYALALDNGAQPIDIPDGPMELKLPAIRASAVRRCT
jgi:4-hydroxyphenylpyruvate dioxygenase